MMLERGLVTHESITKPLQKKGGEAYIRLDWIRFPRDYSLQPKNRK